jgi:hypothetical protein
VHNPFRIPHCLSRPGTSSKSPDVASTNDNAIKQKFTFKLKLTIVLLITNIFAAIKNESTVLETKVS